VAISGGSFNSTLGHHVTINLNRELEITILALGAFIHFCVQKGTRKDLLASGQAGYEPSTSDQFVKHSALNLGDTHTSPYNVTRALHHEYQIP